MIKPSLLISPIFLVVGLGFAAESVDSAWVLSGHPEGFRIDGKVREDRDLSAIAFSPEGVGILAADEGGSLQTLVRTSDAEARIVSTERLDPRGEETDFEGAAYLGGWFHVTGSHGVSKKKGELEEARFRVYRFRVGAGGRGIEALERASLAAVLARDPVLGPYLHAPLQRRGVNIEGLAARDGHLFFGLRSPNLDGDAFIIEVEPEALFSSTSPKVIRHRVRLAPGLGIRSLAETRDGFLILAGNAGAESSKAFPSTVDHAEGTGFHLFQWSPDQSKAARIGPVPGGGGKAEALEVLSETARRIDFVILFDGPRGGAPRRFLLTRADDAADHR